MRRVISHYGVSCPGSSFKFASYLGPSCLSSQLSVILGGDFPFLLRPYLIPSLYFAKFVQEL